MSPEVDAVLSRLEGMPASVERIVEALDDGPRTMAQLRAESGLARRTVYGAVRRLDALGLIRRRTSLQDSRQTYVWLAACPL